MIELPTGRTLPVGTQAPISTSAQGPWQGLLLEHHHLAPFETNDTCCLNNVIFLHLESAVTLEWKDHGRFRPLPIVPGQMCIRPAQMPASLRSRDTGEFLSLSLEPSFLACAACEFDNSDHLELALAQGIEDRLIQAICLALKTEVETGSQSGRLYGESLGTALAVHLVQRHSVQGPRVREYRGGLAKYQLRRSTEYIREHLAEDIPLKTLAAVAGMSPFHFARMFKHSTGLAPHQYLLKCRVERAKSLLLGSNASIADVAAQLGFCDQSHLAAHFKRVFGVTPKKFLREVINRKTIHAP